MRRPGLVMGALLALSCGGSLATSEGSSTDGGSGDAAFADPCRPAGARICAPEQGCAALGAACPGAGCTNVDTLAGGATPDGVCWSDLADLGDVACASCDDGQSCIRRGSVLRCVPNEVCHAFWALGIRNVCTYADKHVYDDRLLPPEPTSCPATAVILPRFHGHQNSHASAVGVFNHGTETKVVQCGVQGGGGAPLQGRRPLDPAGLQGSRPDRDGAA